MVELLSWLVLGVSQTTLIVPPFRHTLGFHRASRFYLTLYLGKDFRYDNPQGLACVKLLEHDDPRTSRDDIQLTLFAVNSGASQIVYNVGLKAIRVYGRRGSGEGEFLDPHGIAATPDGEVFIADTGNDRVVRLRYRKGELSWESTIEGLNRPYGVAVDSKKGLWVTEWGGDAVAVFDSTGRLVQRIKGELVRPTGIAVLDPDAEYNERGEDCIVVIDLDGTRIQKFTRTGSLLSAVTGRLCGMGRTKFAYLAMDRHGNVWVTDELNHQIHKFDADLRYIVSFGRMGSGDGEFISPRGIGIGRKYGQVFIAEAEGGQYYWIGMDGYAIGCFPPEFDASRPGATISFYLTEQARVEIDIFDQEGRLIRSLAPPHRQPIGEVLVVWDGRDDQGSMVRPGRYEVKIRISNTYSTRRYSRKELETWVSCVEGS